MIIRSLQLRKLKSEGIENDTSHVTMPRQTALVSKKKKIIQKEKDIKEGLFKFANREMVDMTVNSDPFPAL
jgi:hypothetical protein